LVGLAAVVQVEHEEEVVVVNSGDGVDLSYVSALQKQREARTMRKLVGRMPW
jgi:hypothetical protein